ncbi:hypothetical protein E2C01_100157 [Portunus trituberculatus]|uniref:Uncharacterized protein n=1 Tax=Portunus trituberculatus TaxID=210409 RepID=A0A5B7KC97_PORTR|nr:hypothetical protein [Portunus trituberculatus]
MLGDLNSNCRCPVMSDLSLNLSECSVRVPFSHFVCATLCFASVRSNFGDLPPTGGNSGGKDNGGGARTKVGKGNGWKNGSYSLYIMYY